MKIVIAGAGDLGFHLAELLSYENQNITLIDNNQDVLDYAATHLDVLTIKGDASSIEILEEAGANTAHLVLAVTTSETTNLVTAALAKKIGAHSTVARVSNPEYTLEEHRTLFEELGIDSIFSPVQLAAKEIKRLIQRCSLTDIFEFENGKIVLTGITLSSNSPLLNRPIRELKELHSNVSVQLIAIQRGHITIIPSGDVVLKRNDHIYFITENKNVDEVENLVGAQKVKVRDIMILGGTMLGFETAKLLEEDYKITLIESNKDRCKFLAENLLHALVINGKSDNIDLLQQEGIGDMDAFIALTNNAETNIIASLTAKNNGVFKTIAQVENKEYTRISQDIGVDTLINKKLIAANNIFRFVRKGRVKAITGLHGVDAEVIEFVVTKNSKMTRVPLKFLNFPKTAIIGGVIRGEESLIPDGNFQIELNDKVVVFALPEAIAKVEKMFH